MLLLGWAYLYGGNEEQTDSDQREREGDNGGRRGRASQGTCIKDPWSRTKGGGGLNVGGGRWVGQGRVMEEKWGQL